MPQRPGFAAFEALFGTILARLNLYWSGPGKEALRAWASRGTPSTGLDELLAAWIDFGLEGADEALDLAVSILAREAPRLEDAAESGEGPIRKTKAHLLGEGRFTMAFRHGFSVGPVVNLITNLADEQAALVRDLLYRGMAAEMSIDETVEELRKFVGLNKRQIEALARAEERLSRELSGDALQKELEKLRKKAVRYRSWMIARTSYQRLLQEAVVEQAKSVSSIFPAFKKWLVTPDERLCPVCKAMEAKEVDLRARFKLPDGREIELPAESHPNCRCSLVIVRRTANVDFFRPENEERRFQEYLSLLPESERQAVAEAVEDVRAAARKALDESDEKALREAMEARTREAYGHVMKVLKRAKLEPVVVPQPLEAEKKAAHALFSALLERASDAIPQLDYPSGPPPTLNAQNLRLINKADGGPIKVVVKRRFARSYYNWREITLYVGNGTYDVSPTLLHELGHHIEETSPRQLWRLSDHLRRTYAIADRVVSLRRLSAAYDSSEEGYINPIDPYFCNVYPGQKSTEILSTLLGWVARDRGSPLYFERALLAHVIYALRLY